jgi:hypothetical protein
LAEVALGAILLMAQAGHSTLGASDFSQCMNGPLRTRGLGSGTGPVRSGSSLAVMSGERMTSDPLADTCQELTDKYRDRFHAENIPGASQE